ncbi:DUF2975 domain-containing protein [Streptomyces sp. NPDC054933]
MRLVPAQSADVLPQDHTPTLDKGISFLDNIEKRYASGGRNMNDMSWWSRVNGRTLELVLFLGCGLAAFGGSLFFADLLGPEVSSPRDVHLADAAAAIPHDVKYGAVTLHRTADAQLNFAHPDFTQRLLLSLPSLVGILLLIVILVSLLLLTRTFRKGDYFAPENARRLAVIAVAVLLTGTLVPALDGITTQLLINGTPMESVIRYHYQLDLNTALMALFIAAAAQAFRRGTRLHADTEGLV